MDPLAFNPKRGIEWRDNFSVYLDPDKASTMLLRFASCDLDMDRRELRVRGASTHVEPQVFDLLLYLIANRNHVVSKDEMVDAVWGGRIVSDVTLNSRINAARRAVGDNGKAQALIRTVPRRGFRFVADSVAIY